VIAHIVLFRPKADLSAAERQTFVMTLERTCRDIDTVRRAIVGRARTSTTGVAPAYPYAAVIEFDDEPGFRSYLDHPRHAELRELFWRTCEATVIADIDAAEARSTASLTWLADPASERV